IKYLIRISTYNKTDARILDFFAGSGTTGQAVMEINLEDNKNHHFTLIQLDEKIADKSAQYNFAIKNKILPTVDQLLIYRLKTAREKLHFSENFIIKKVGEL
ncbi:MAG: site-specific DNA-methyltransferase, partial [Candidatus Nomurabacteria bacterium]|nr:site-specific DNA-methyltransferase [Candidatus Nomurabacteria bacterium]